MILKENKYVLQLEISQNDDLEKKDSSAFQIQYC